jgi:hypothetical protein
MPWSHAVPPTEPQPIGFDRVFAQIEELDVTFVERAPR